jgi:hypothetical protein
MPSPTSLRMRCSCLTVADWPGANCPETGSADPSDPSDLKSRLLPRGLVFSAFIVSFVSEGSESLQMRDFQRVSKSRPRHLWPPLLPPR